MIGLGRENGEWAVVIKPGRDYGDGRRFGSETFNSRRLWRAVWNAWRGWYR
jgi:hypothetical protein